jgi:RNA polymerase sigma-70 factor (ECF subfamily)
LVHRFDVIPLRPASSYEPKISQTFAAGLIAQLPALWRYAIALCDNRELTDDLVQDAIERALSRAPSTLEPERLGAWLRSVVHNLFVDELRRQRRRGVRVDEAEMENDLALSTAPADHLASSDVGKAMASLSIDHRQILVLASAEELSYREIAEELSVPLGTVMSRLARARAALRAALETPARAPPAKQGS